MPSVPPLALRRMVLLLSRRLVSAMPPSERRGTAVTPAVAPDACRRLLVRGGAMPAAALRAAASVGDSRALMLPLRADARSPPPRLGRAVTAPEEEAESGEGRGILLSPPPPPPPLPPPPRADPGVRFSAPSLCSLLRFSFMAPGRSRPVLPGAAALSLLAPGGAARGPPARFSLDTPAGRPAEAALPRGVALPLPLPPRLLPWGVRRGPLAPRGVRPPPLLLPLLAAPAGR